MIRKPVVAGQFYTQNPEKLRREVAGFSPERKDKIDAMGVISPHAGYVYSGAVAGSVLSSISPRPTYIILGPNHTGSGKPFGIDLGRSWETPLGEVVIDNELGEAILEESLYVEKDAICHEREHSIEVQLPFLQYLNKGFNFVPIVIASASRKIYKNIGKSLASAVKKTKKDVAIIASSDMTHYEPQESAKQKDMMAIEKILELDVDGFLDTVEEHDISMCGFAPTAVMLSAACELGARKARLIKYNTSADASGDYSAVVGYAGIVVY